MLTVSFFRSSNEKLFFPHHPYERVPNILFFHLFVDAILRCRPGNRRVHTLFCLQDPSAHLVLAPAVPTPFVVPFLIVIKH